MNKTRMAILGILAVAAVLLAAAIPVAGQATIIAPSIWAGAAPKIDGASKDWEGVPLANAEKGAVQYAFRNDGSNLYVLFVIADQKTRSTIEELGLTIYVDRTGQDAKDYGILFRRKRITANESIALLEKQGPVSDEQKEKLRATPFYNFYFAEVVDKKGDVVPVPAGVAGPPAMFKFATEKKNLVFELMIPLTRLAPSLPGLAAAPGETVSLGFEWGGPTEAQRKAIARARGEKANITNETGQSSLSMSSGGRGDPTSGATGIDRFPRKFLFWTKTQLAAGK